MNIEYCKDSPMQMTYEMPFHLLNLYLDSIESLAEELPLFSRLLGHCGRSVFKLSLTVLLVGERSRISLSRSNPEPSVWPRHLSAVTIPYYPHRQWTTSSQRSQPQADLISGPAARKGRLALFFALYPTWPIFL